MQSQAAVVHWICLLYGHDWHHEGTFDVHIAPDHMGVSFTCTACGRERELDLTNGDWVDHATTPR